MSWLFIPFSDVFRVIDLTGVLLNGILGGRLARSKNFDAIGFGVLALMSALGGGIIRDLMLASGPPVALTDPYYLTVALIGAGIAFLWRFDGKWSLRLLLIADGLVLGTWAATGVTKTLNCGFGVVPALLLGLVTAVGGGMVRDVAAGNVPAVFGGNNLYAVPALVAAMFDVLFFKLEMADIGMLVAALSGCVFVVIAHWRKWQLPKSGMWSVSLTPKQWKEMREKHTQEE
ncbi:MAG: TRIC cation channel family protein [Actinomycetaceae bacterium]|nr:TRIC cation channel family protein [Actinomycetaceae bacterium]